MNRTMLDLGCLENDFDWWFRRPWFEREREVENLYNQILLELVSELRGLSLHSRSNLFRSHRLRRSPRRNYNGRHQSSMNITLQLPQQTGSSSLSRSTDAINECSSISSDVEICAICREQFKEKDNIRQLPCEHLFHPDCLHPWLLRRRTCPTCRQHLN